jgi:hypothetical protein
MIRMTSARSFPSFALFCDRDQGQESKNVHELNGKWLTDGFGMGCVRRFVIICRKSFIRRMNCTPFGDLAQSRALPVLGFSVSLSRGPELLVFSGSAYWRALAHSGG